MFSSTRNWALLLLAIALVALVANASSSLDDQSKELATKYMSQPNNLVRLLLYNGREHPSSYKRSSSALDPLAGGITLGKRGISPVEFLNMEPMYGRYHAGPNMYHLRWAPVSGFEALEDD